LKKKLKKGSKFKKIKIYTKIIKINKKLIIHMEIKIKNNQMLTIIKILINNILHQDHPIKIQVQTTQK
jgi:hypothetical protein